MKQRVQKFLASKGHGSRREVERWIREDRLKINGLQAEIGTFVEGKYNKYWNREWYDFKFGVNYVIF